MKSSLEPSDLRAHVKTNAGLSVHSLGLWRKSGDTEFTALGNFLHELKYEPLSEQDLCAGVNLLVDLMLPEMKKIWPEYPAEYCISVPPNLPRSRDIPGRVAEQIGLRTRIRTRTDIMRRIKHVKSMKNTRPDERREELDGAYVAKKPLMSEKGLLIIDDVYDTGSTVRAVRQALWRAGVRGKMHFFAFAHLDRSSGNWKAL